MAILVDNCKFFPSNVFNTPLSGSKELDACHDDRKKVTLSAAFI